MEFQSELKLKSVLQLNAVIFLIGLSFGGEYI